ncbi:hypothetical protein A0H81_02499 [Grifola frondosa]|uniref:F-box domain-containing protein n=1 Tax=Grifola frondosa TaxID=5627 RepID=A0A1C7ML06_GRIFR|nr:hypothetical protein A0H81_02499 [Grifola frondosa]
MALAQSVCAQCTHSCWGYTFVPVAAEVVPGMSSTTLPPELHDNIIDHLWDDRATLEACSLTCQAWIAKNLRIIIMRIIDYIRHLIIHGDSIAFMSLPIQPLDQLDPDFPKDLLSLGLNKVEALSLSSVRWIPSFRSGLVEDRNIYSSMFWNGIKDLRLNKVKFDTAGDLLQLLSAPSHLTKLTLFDIRFPDHPLAHPTSFILKPQIGDGNHVYIDSIAANVSTACINLLFNSLVEPRVQLHIRELELSWQPGDHQLAVHTLLERIGPSLQHLRIMSRRSITLEAVVKDTILANNTQLVTLHLEEDANIDHTGHFEWMPRMISRVQSLQLEEITISITSKNQNIINVLPWVDLDASLAHLVQLLPRLTVYIDVLFPYPGHLANQAQDLISPHIPLLLQTENRIELCLGMRLYPPARHQHFDRRPILPRRNFTHTYSQSTQNAEIWCPLGTAQVRSNPFDGWQ